MTPPVHVTIANNLSQTPSLVLSALFISEGDSVTIEYTSTGVVLPLSIELWSLQLGFIAKITDDAPTNGSYSFNFNITHSPIDNAFLVLYTPSGARAHSSTFSLYPRPSLSNVSLGADTIYKGLSYNVMWTSTGLSFPIAVLLYQGTFGERTTVSGQKCVPWVDRGITHDECILNYDQIRNLCDRSR